MSMSPISRSLTESKAIPRRLRITDPSQMPNEYSTTPGGTIYSTTPGGTKIVYERAFLMNLRNSPISQTPPKYNIPSGLLRDMAHSPIGNTNHTLATNTIDETPEQFAMEI